MQIPNFRGNEDLCKLGKAYLNDLLCKFGLLFLQHSKTFDIYTVSQKNIPDIFDCNLKTNYQILIIFGTDIPDTTWHQMTI